MFVKVALVKLIRFMTTIINSASMPTVRLKPGLVFRTWSKLIEWTFTMSRFIILRFLCDWSKQFCGAFNRGIYINRFYICRYWVPDFTCKKYIRLHGLIQMENSLTRKRFIYMLISKLTYPQCSRCRTFVFILLYFSRMGRGI